MELGKTEKLIISVLICELVGIIGTLFSNPQISSWYEALVKPAFQPPEWLFAPIWMLLYALMGLALFFIWQEKDHHPDVPIAMRLFGLHLIFNAAWSILFFGMREITFAFWDIFVLWLLVLFMTALFFKISRIAGYMLIPYLVWISFATCLNLCIWILN